MSNAATGLPLRHLRQLFSAGTLAGQSDAELLERFARKRDSGAFEDLMSRHGPMVLAVCRGVLKDPHDTHDAFQATFLVLVRKAHSLWAVKGSLGSWLYRVAYRIAIKINAASNRRREIETRARESPRVQASGPDPDHEVILSALREEIGLLPEKYRAPIVLCHLEQLTHTEAAQQLGWSADTVRGRVARARLRLRKRLQRRGLTLSSALLLSLLPGKGAPAAVPKSWFDSTFAAATAAGVGRTTFLLLAAGGLRAMVGVRVLAGASLPTAIALGVFAGLVGAQWIAPEDDLDARALAFALRLKPVVRPIELTPQARPAPAIESRYPPPPSPGYQWVGYSNGAGPLSTQSRPSWAGLFSGLVSLRPGITGMFYVDEGENGDLVVTVCDSLEAQAPNLGECRPVLLDEHRKRYFPKPERATRCRSEAGDRTSIERFRLERNLLPVDPVIDVGIECKRADSLHSAPSRVAEAAATFFPSPLAAAPSVGVEPSDGCSWAIAPRPLGRGDWSAASSGTRGTVVCDVSPTLSGILSIHLAYPSRSLVHNIGGCVEEYRVVVVDRSGGRHVLTGTQQYFDSDSGPGPRGTLGMVDTAAFRLELGPVTDRTTVRFPVAPAEVRLIGVERLSPLTLPEARMSAFLAYISTAIDSFEQTDSDWRAANRAAPRRQFAGSEYPYINHRVAWLGAFEFLQGRLAKPTKTPEWLRSARIDDFMMYMRREEFIRGPGYVSRVDPTLVYAYGLIKDHRFDPTRQR
jgi:RNA polymerase sigma factor (sigma-70 family)